MVRGHSSVNFPEKSVTKVYSSMLSACVGVNFPEKRYATLEWPLGGIKPFPEK